MMPWRVLCCAALLIATASAQESSIPLEGEAVEAAAPDASAPAYEEVLVSGEQPGPGLWKVSHADHAMWIIGTLLPLPKQMSWKSKEVEALLDESQEVLIYGGFRQRPDIGWFRGMLLLPSVLSAAKNPDGAMLQDLLPTDVHARWLTLKAKYIGKDKGIERWRPTFAVQQLRSKATAKSGLVYKNSVLDFVLKRAKQRKLKITTVRVEQIVHVEKPRSLLKRFAKTPFADVECFTSSLDRIEQNVADMRARANAWSVGDVGALRQLTTDSQADCINLLIDAVVSGKLTEEFVEKEQLQNALASFERGQKELDEQWLTAAQAALEKNRVTLAVLPMQQILKSDGYIAALQTRGYAIEEP